LDVLHHVINLTVLDFFLCSVSELGISFGHCFKNWSGNNEKINAFNNRSVFKFSVGR
jgi:hypothetical protein